MIIIAAAAPRKRTPTTEMAMVLSSKPDSGNFGGGVGLGAALQQVVTEGFSEQAC